MATIRYQVSPVLINQAVEQAIEQFHARLKEKGKGIFVSSHEIVAVMDEEVREVHDALRHNSKGELKKELLDVIVACLHGVASIDSNNMDW